MTTPLPTVDPAKELERRRAARDAHMDKARYWVRRATKPGQDPVECRRKARTAARTARQSNRSVIFYRRMILENANGST